MVNDIIRSLIVAKAASSEQIRVAYFSLTVTVVGTVLNFLTFIVLCRRTFRNMKARPTLYYMRTMAVFDILMLYGWNLDHYLAPIHEFLLQTLNMPLCKILSFFNYFAAQSSAWLRVFVCFDRYLSLSRLRKTWFNRSKNVFIIIGSIILVCTLINALFFVVGCSYTSTGQVTPYSWAFEIYPLWDYVNLGVYNCVPFILMVILNCGVIYHLVRLRNTTTVQHSRIQHRAISITLVITTFLFLLMTVPVTVGFAFFGSANITILRVLDGLLYTYHILSFPLYMVTFPEFRQEFINMITCGRSQRRVIPTVTDVTNLRNTTKQ